ncbi:MAG TPA: hypothetical protein VK364_10350, partial [Hymenobacter sp.]|nr:hypothetical protein [Hymenobacter sp.]
EADGLRVKNQHINCLYAELNQEQFHEAYNHFNKYLHFDFSPVCLGSKEYVLSQEDQDYLEQSTVANSIYFYAVNRIKLVVRPGEVSLASPTDYVIALLDKKYGVDTEVSLLLGARIVRTSFESYYSAVKSRRRYYDR